MTLHELRLSSGLPRMTLEGIAAAFGRARGIPPISKQAVLQLERRHIRDVPLRLLMEYAGVIGLPVELLTEYIVNEINETYGNK